MCVDIVHGATRVLRRRPCMATEVKLTIELHTRFIPSVFVQATSGIQFPISISSRHSMMRRLLHCISFVSSGEPPSHADGYRRHTPPMIYIMLQRRSSTRIQFSARRSVSSGASGHAKRQASSPVESENNGILLTLSYTPRRITTARLRGCRMMLLYTRCGQRTDIGFCVR